MQRVRPATQQQGSGLYPVDERAEMLPLVPAGSETVLEVGCGRGGFGRTLRRSGRFRTVWAVEQNEDFGREAAAQYDRMLVGSYPEVVADCPLRFDCVVFNDVLEHMVDPWAALRTARRYLEPGGAVVASVPNVRNARTVFDLCARGDWTYVDMGVLDRTHLRFFTRRTIRTLFGESGYLVEELRGIHPLGEGHFPIGRITPLVLRDFAFVGFGVRARPVSG